ncbi:Sodium/hydrogen exchanger [Caligus rogercresseyi]|uniref:Sodium/hydrogen exchanger n=1 Tax=Caligus rogercresseyi TaxID=217165 RepID=A0A7T8GXF3_CALRO|nr:Sodium/hydrogen exchanger [Caligus rogercresseyi]
MEENMLMDNRSLEMRIMFDPNWGWKGHHIILIGEILFLTTGVVLLKSKSLERLIDWVPELQWNFFEEDFDRHTIVMNALIPPIILEGSYKLYSKELLFQIFGIMCFAMVGTIFCIASVGSGIYFLEKGLGFKESLLLATIVSAVDPVTVLAIFDQLQVSQSLYVLIFGESLLNDGVTLAAFESLKSMTMTKEEIPNGIFALGLLSVLTKTLGGGLIGAMGGMLSGIFAKLVSSQTFQGIPLVLISYASFMISETLSFSGIVGIIVCGLMQRRYAFQNLRSKSRYSLVRLIRFIATTGEAVIFILLGGEACEISWKTVDLIFIVSVILLCSYHPKHLFVIAYGGLRGAMSFVMIKTLLAEMSGVIRDPNLFREATLGVVLFTIYVLGGTVRLLASALKLNSSSEIPADRLLSIILDRITQHATAGMETIWAEGSDEYIPGLKPSSYLTSDMCIPSFQRLKSLKLRSIASEDLTNGSEEDKKTTINLNIFPEPLKFQKDGSKVDLMHPLDDSEESIPLSPSEVTWLKKLRLRRKMESIKLDSGSGGSLYSMDEN